LLLIYSLKNDLNRVLGEKKRAKKIQKLFLLFERICDLLRNDRNLANQNPRACAQGKRNRSWRFSL